jgi:ATP-binding cassette subfamily B protein
MLALYTRVLGLLRAEAGLAALLVFANAFVAIAQFAEPLLFGRMIDLMTKGAVQENQDFLTTAQPMVYWLGAAFVSILGGVMVSLHADRLSHRSRLSVMAHFFAHVLSLPQAFHNRHHSGRLLKIQFDGAGSMAWIWLSFFRDHCATLMMLGVLLPMTLFSNWRLAVILVGLLLIFAVLTALVARKTHHLQNAVETYHSSMAEHAADAIGNVSVVQSFTRVGAETTALRHLIHHVLSAQVPVLTWWAMASIMTRAATSLSLLLIFVVGVTLNRQGLASLGDVVAFMSLAGLLVGRMEQVVYFFNHLFLQTPKLAEFFQVLDLRPQVSEKADAIDPVRLQGDVTFEDVSFSYDGQRPAVEGLSFHARPGERIALVGTTGSGKSTTMSLLYRAFDPSKGRILIDGMDLKDMTLEGLRRNVGVVFQEPMLFARSIRDNVLIGRPDAREDEVWQALQRAQADDFVKRSPEGLETVIGERGRSLSGGERQRIAIARALLKNPPLLILDEATAALDAATEARLQKALDDVMRDRTTFIIAHRLSTIRQADRIFVLEHGRIIEQGHFDELVAAQGVFAQLVRTQFGDTPSGAH